MENRLLTAGAGIRHAEVDGLRIILDLRLEQYRILDEVASVMWLALTGETEPAAALRRLADRYDANPATLAADLEAFGQRCQQEGLLEPVGTTATEPARPAPPRPWFNPGSGKNAWLCLVDTQRRIQRQGFSQTYAAYSQIAPAHATGLPLSAAVATFLRAENFFIAARAPDDCLARSLTLYRFLAEAGFPAVHHIGVKRIPFHAHAWVECAGLALLDERVDTYTPIARLWAKPPDA